MEGDFELSKSGWYETQNVAEIEGFDQDEHGNTWYNVKFQANAETIMWLAKTKPEENKKFYGHIEKTSSGKRLRFKRDPEPEDGIKPDNAARPTKPEYKDHSKDITLGMVWKTVAQIRGLPENDVDFSTFFEIVKSHLEELILMSEKMK